jgi:hypothetical protein
VQVFLKGQFESARVIELTAIGELERVAVTISSNFMIEGAELPNALRGTDAADQQPVRHEVLAPKLKQRVR